MDLKTEPQELLQRIVRTIPVGYGGYIIGKKGSFKSQLNSEFGAEFRLVNFPLDPLRQIIYIDCPADQYSLVEKKIDEKIAEINRKINSNTINTVTSNPDQLKPTVELGKMIPGRVINMSHSNDLIVILENNKEAKKKYENMHISINSEYVNSPPRVPFPVGPGCICIALGSRAKYYRALVLGYEYDLATVYFVDIGKFELVPYNRLFKIKVKYLDLPFRAVPAKLNNVSMNTNIDGIADVVYSRFLRNVDSTPKKVYLYFTHVECCIPHVNIYVQKPGTEMIHNEFIDLLELLTSVQLADTVPSNVDLSLSERFICKSNCDIRFHRPINFAYYESVMSIKSLDDVNRNN